MNSKANRKRHPGRISNADHEFVCIVAAGAALGDGRTTHIRAFKRLVAIIQKLAPATKHWPESKSKSETKK